MAYRKWAQDNPERVRARNRRWAARHREKTREKAKAWRLANPDGAKALWRASKSRRRARELGAPGRTTRVKLQARWDYFGGRCNWPSNLRPACLVCNTRKGVQPPRQVRARRQAPSPHARTNIKRAQNSTGE
jgi:hypothetical protein